MKESGVVIVGLVEAVFLGIACFWAVHMERTDTGKRLFAVDESELWRVKISVRTHIIAIVVNGFAIYGVSLLIQHIQNAR